MKEEKINSGGTSIDDEASETSEGQQNGQVQQPTNSDAQTSADSKQFTDKFLETLAEQAKGDKDVDKDIIRIIIKWATKPTVEAKNHYKKGYKVIRYIGKKLVQAGVPFEKALEYLIKKFPDLDPEYIKSELAVGYQDGVYDEKLRDYILKGSNKKTKKK